MNKKLPEYLAEESIAFKTSGPAAVLKEVERVNNFFYSLQKY